MIKQSYIKKDYVYILNVLFILFLLTLTLQYNYKYEPVKIFFVQQFIHKYVD